MKILSKKTYPILLVGALGAIALYVMATQLDLLSKWEIHTSVDDLSHGRNIDESIKTLRQTPRGPTTEALKAALEEEGGTAWGMANVLALLGEFKEERAINRAAESEFPAVRRGFAWYRQGDAERAEQIGDIAMAWLRDEEAADRKYAAMIARRIDRPEVVPELVRILKAERERPESAALLVHVMGALSKFRPDGIVPDVLAIARDDTAPHRLRSEAFGLLTVLKEVPRDEFRALLIQVARDDDPQNLARHNAISELGRKENATEEGWEVMKEILFAGESENEIVQRSTLRALGKSYPLDRMLDLLLDRRVYAHRFYGIRTDAASGIGHLREYLSRDEKKQRLALTVLADLMADRDPRDVDDGVPRQAWIAHWLICGTVIIPDEFKDRRRMFLKVPAPLKEEDLLRLKLFSFSHSSPQITRPQVEALSFCTLTREDVMLRQKDPAEYDRRRAAREEQAAHVAQTMRNHIEQCLEKMKGDAAANDTAPPPDKDDEEKGPDEPEKKDEGG